MAARWVAIPVAVACISTSAILVRLTVASPLVTASNRLLIAAALLLAFALAFQRADLRRAWTQYRWPVLLSGALLGIHFALWTHAVFLTSVASAVFLIDTHPAFVALGAAWLLGERTGGLVWLGIVLTALGGLVITGGDFPVGERALLGDGLAVAGAVAFAAYLVIGRAVRPGLGLAAYTGLVYLTGGVLMGAVAVASGRSLFEAAGHDLLLWLGLVLLPTLGGHTVFNWTLRYVPASVVGVSILGEPVGATWLAWLVLAEAPPPTALLGGVIALLGLYFALRAR